MFSMQSDNLEDKNKDGIPNQRTDAGLPGGTNVNV